MVNKMCDMVLSKDFKLILLLEIEKSQDESPD